MKAHISVKTLLPAVLAIFILLVLSVSSFAMGVHNPERTQGLKAPAPQGQYVLVDLKGPGTFLSASLTKQGGSNDLTFVILDIDGRNVVNASIAAISNWGFTTSNPYILDLVKSTGSVKTLTIGQATPLHFQKELKLRVNVKETGVVQILANVIHGK